MRLTVGPLPPAVYWRRRAVVLGAVLLFLVVVVYSCSNAGGSGRKGGADGSPTPPAGTTPSGSVLTPETGAPPAGGGEPVEGEPGGEQPSDGEPIEGEPVGDAGDVGTVPAEPPAAGPEVCTDEEMLVTPVPSQSSMKVGVTIEIKLKIKNVSGRTCTRDVGASAQEVYLRLGGEKVWSSDTCGTAQGSDPRSFPPGIEHEYRVAWNGKKSTDCEGGVASGPNAPAGGYQFFGRLGTKLSEPVKLTITN